jgi:hypothetical protein
MPDQSTLGRSNRPIDPSTGPLLPRLGMAILLRREFYDAVATDPRALRPAGAIVCIAAVARESIGLYQASQDFKAWGLLLLLVVVFAILRWLLYATIMYPIARAISAEPVPYKRLLRCLGFAETPAVLSLVGFMLPDRFFPWVQFGVGAWLLLATVVAVRSATGVTMQRAAVIGVLGFVAYLGLGLAVDVATRDAPGPPDPPPALTLRRSL